MPLLLDSMGEVNVTEETWSSSDLAPCRVELYRSLLKKPLHKGSLKTFIPFPLDVARKHWELPIEYSWVKSTKMFAAVYHRMQYFGGCFITGSDGVHVSVTIQMAGEVIVSNVLM